VEKGGEAPFPTDRSLVVLSEAKDLRLFPKGKKEKMVLIPSHFERSEKSPQFNRNGKQSPFGLSPKGKKSSTSSFLTKTARSYT